MLRPPAALLVAALMASGCGDLVDEVLPAGGSCNVAATNTCTDYTGTAWRTPGTAQSTCQRVGNGATYSSGSCATARRIGSCRVRAGGAEELTVRFYSPHTAQTAQAGCTQQGGVYTGG